MFKRVPRKGPNRVCAALLIASVLAACSVARSLPVVDESRLFVGCESKMGAYALPRRVLKIRITKEKDKEDTQKDNYILQEITADPVPDNAHIYCLDHKRNPLAHDTIRVFKNKIEADGKSVSDSEADMTPYLQLIASRSVDHTAGIIRNIIRAVFIGLSSNPKFTTGRASINVKDNPTVAEFEVDPFDFTEMATVNKGLRRFGFCLVLEDYTFDRGTTTPSHYCDKPREQAEGHAPPANAAVQNMRWFVPKPKSGIFYRPRAPYQLAVYTKHFPDHRGPWTLGMLKTIEMENIMPVVSVGINRAIFATRRTGLIFDDGTLTNVCISKGSSVAGAIEIPLEIVYGIIALPSEMLRGIFTHTQARAALLKQRNDLVAAQNRYIAFLNSKQQNALTPALPEQKSLQISTEAANLPSKDKHGAAQDAESIRNSPSDALNEICKKLEAAGPIKLSDGTTDQF